MFNWQKFEKFSRGEICSNVGFKVYNQYKLTSIWKGEDKIVFLDGFRCDVLVHINAIASSNQDDSRIEYYYLFCLN